MSLDSVLRCPACRAKLAIVVSGELVETNGPLYNDGDTLDWFGEAVELPSPPIYVAEQYLEGTCNVCEHPLCWLLVEIAQLPFEISTSEAAMFIGGIDWQTFDHRIESVSFPSAWSWVTARMSAGSLQGQRHWLGPFSIAAAAASREGGLYYLLRGIIKSNWARMMELWVNEVTRS